MHGHKRGFVALFVALGVACGADSSPSPSSLDFTVFEVDRLTTRMSEDLEERILEPERAFLLRTTCPRIERAVYTPEKTGKMGVLQVWGQGVEEAWGLVAWPKSAPVGRSQPKEEEDGSRRFAVGCRDCVLLLGMEASGMPFGCIGPGHSLKIAAGKLVRE